MTRFGLAVVLTASAGIAPRAAASGLVTPPGRYADILRETALVVWDPATQTEHLIWSVTVDGTAPEFGFLVPTPTRPDIGESDPAVFDRLDAITARKVEDRRVTRVRERFDPRRPGFNPPAFDRFKSDLFLDRLGSWHTRHAEEHLTCGFDATATGVPGAAGWAAGRGYESGPALAGWLKPYAEQDWALTAFRMTADHQFRDFRRAHSACIRMSFRTDRPFHPYRDRDPDAPPRPLPPGETRRPASFLNVYLAAPIGRATAAVGDQAGWSGQVVWSDRLSADQVRDLAAAAQLPAGPPAGDLWLTAWEDESSPRPGTGELYFAPADDQTPVHRPPIIREVVEWIDPEPEPPEDPALRRLLLKAAVFGVAGIVYGLYRLIPPSPRSDPPDPGAAESSR